MMGRAYHRDYSRNYYYKRKERIIERLGGKCVRCGSCEKLEIHHRDAYNKCFAVTKKILSIPLDKLEEELSKCELLCKKCHQEESIRQFRERTQGRGFICKNGKPHPNSKKCICVTTGETFDSVNLAARKYGLHQSAVSNVCNGLAKQTHGYQFRFAGEVAEWSIASDLKSEDGESRSGVQIPPSPPICAVARSASGVQPIETQSERKQSC